MILAANWKMKMGYPSAINFLSRFKELITPDSLWEQFIFFPPALLSGLFQKEKFYWGGQNVYHQAEGAWTGENSARTLKEMGAHFCLLGHSERRYVFGESDSEIESKFSLLQETGLIPVLCVGEALSERLNKKEVLIKQLSWIKNYKKYDKLPWKPEELPPAFKDIPFIIAYEPIWSIGTGQLPSYQEIHETIQFLKEYLPFSALKVFYGGSVDRDNIEQLSECSLLDGFLVGSSSLDSEDFYNMYQKCKL